ncbi:response regulator [Marinomonas mediterranea]|jgi:response regulator receiver modulated diguanylate cyclase|uniref:diguanylate cyclase n=1 Tax=Marinomonas mediterranea (strain ATCC 700492 / JCM 21426 / NBRC 103028 / MMB-1) TaxID=717774 RepID=F2K0N2_MARM1|nr:response regulator [Marinomonas mediterranea]ADZ91016.1 response regulator receiver modulated diguanylate cyclase [Marinomonas mediterranea MMB-1]WCN09053.1 response regulator [Marinomonas mediterranea]WCN13085.1 response regulator [Marinomonas mediterranea]WCN17155.1 response regulator [Marinomonas mediterranea MMB-1]
MQYRILVVEDSPVVLKVLKHLVSQSQEFEPVLCSCYKEAEEKLAEGESFFASIVDLNLPDAENGEIVDLVLEQKIPCIVLTGNFDDSLRVGLLNKGVLDYVTKESRYSFNHVMKVVNRLKKNQDIKVLVAEDSSTSRLFIKILLEQYRFNVIEANDGQEALAKLEADSEIKMLITDHNMPVVNGYDLVRMLRRNIRFQDLVIIGLSAEGDTSLSAKFIKSGANDFLKKPFYHEEFHCRVISNLESQEMLETIRDLANLDPLTKLYNRRYLFEEGEALYQKGAVAAVLDLDFFKKVNDTYGHFVGDELLKEFSSLLIDVFNDALIARFGGEEFCLISALSVDEVVGKLDEFMDLVRGRTFTTAEVSVTCSIGVCSEQQSTLGEAVNLADNYLYDAKRTGRDRIVLSEE